MTWARPAPVAGQPKPLQRTIGTATRGPDSESWWLPMGGARHCLLGEIPPAGRAGRPTWGVLAKLGTGHTRAAGRASLRKPFEGRCSAGQTHSTRARARSWTRGGPAPRSRSGELRHLRRMRRASASHSHHLAHPLRWRCGSAAEQPVASLLKADWSL